MEKSLLLSTVLVLLPLNEAAFATDGEACESAVGSKRTIVDYFVAWDPQMDAVRLVFRSLDALSVWATAPARFDQYNPALRDQVRDLKDFYQARTGYSLFDRSHLTTVLAARDQVRAARSTAAPTREQLISEARAISEDLFSAALAYLESPETFFGRLRRKN